MPKYSRTHALVRAFSPVLRGFRRLSGLLDRLAGVSTDSYNLESLENRQLLSGAVVTINGTSGNDAWYLRVNPDDAGETQLFAGNLADGSPSRILDRNNLHELDFDAIGGDDTLTVDLRYGMVSMDQRFLLNFAGGSGTNNLVMTGRADLHAVFSPSGTAGTGAMTIGLRSFSFSGVT
ncbi:MAG: hypothetical protein ACHRHE_20010, partial [Tepidisphaerales bacterium]